LAAGAGQEEAADDAELAVRRAPSRGAARIVRSRSRTLAGDSTGAYADLVEAQRLYPMNEDYLAQRNALAAALEKASEAAPR